MKTLLLLYFYYLNINSYHHCCYSLLRPLYYILPKLVLLYPQFWSTPFTYASLTTPCLHAKQLAIDSGYPSHNNRSFLDIYRWSYREQPSFGWSFATTCSVLTIHRDTTGRLFVTRSFYLDTSIHLPIFPSLRPYFDRYLLDRCSAPLDRAGDSARSINCQYLSVSTILSIVCGRYWGKHRYNYRKYWRGLTILLSNWYWQYYRQNAVTSKWQTLKYTNKTKVLCV